MTRPVTALGNLGRRAVRRLMSVHKPLVRRARRQARADQQATMIHAVGTVEQEIAAIAATRGSIVVGPWLAEVGYEVLYWVPFLRWVQDRYQIGPDRFVALSRGGLAEAYQDVAGRYIDIFDHLSPTELASRNEERQRAKEAGGRKQTATGGALEDELLRYASAQIGGQPSAVLHPSLMFRLFRETWHGNLPLDVLWTHTVYQKLPRPARPAFRGVPDRYVAAKFYSGAALHETSATRAALRGLVAAVASHTPVVVLDTGLVVDDHEDFPFAGIPNVMSARDWMSPRTNLAVQLTLIAHAESFLGTCGGLAWMAPFMGVPTVAVYEDDRFLAPHLLIARQAGQRAGAAEFVTLDLRAISRVNLYQRD